MLSLEVTEGSTKLPTQKSQRSYQHKHKAVISPHLPFSNYNSARPRRAFNTGPACLLENGFSKECSSIFYNLRLFKTHSLNFRLIAMRKTFSRRMKPSLTLVVGLIQYGTPF